MTHPAAHLKPSRRRLSRPAVVAAAIGLLTGALAAVPGVAYAVGGSTFESADGNLVFDGSTGKTNDWQTVTGQHSFHQASDLPSGQGDNSLGQGSKDDLTTVTVVNGSIPNNKSDLTRFYEFQDAGTDGKQYLYLAWERANTLGTANFSFELNQSPDQPSLTSPGTVTLNRLTGDALILFDFAKGGNVPTISLSRWVTSGTPKTVCQANSTVPCWGKAKVISGGTNPLADGQVNQGASGITDPITGTALAQFEFGEAGVNLTDTGLITGCRGFAKAWVRSRSSAAFDAELKDFIAPFDVNIQVPPDATNTHADSLDPTDSDGAVALHLTDPALGVVDLPAPHTTSSRTGPGEDGPRSNSQANVSLPSDGSVVTASLLNESTDSFVDGTTAKATQTTIAEVQGLNVLHGTLTADVVKAVSITTASPDGASTSSLASGVANVAIDPDGHLGPASPENVNVTPGLVVPLSSTFFGAGSYVAFLQEDVASHRPPFGTVNTTGTYDASLRVTYVHVHVTDRDPVTAGNQTLDLTVSKAYGLSRYTGLICAAPQEVSGNASVLRAASPLLSPDPVTLGFVHIAPSGGHDYATVAGARYPNSGPAVVSVGLATTDTRGSFDKTHSGSTSFADVANVCIAQAADGSCLVSAQAVHSQSNASATGGGRSADGTGTAYVGLVVAGTPITVTPDPNTLQGVTGGMVILNEQYCDDPSATLANRCASGSSAGITVNAIHVIVPGVLDVIVGQSHADATFV